MNPDPPEDNWFAEYLIRQQRAQDDARVGLSGLLDQLAALQIDEVHIEYDGYDDSGTIDDVRAQRGADTTELPVELREALVTADEQILPAGWENNDGAFGELVLDVNQRSLARQHNWRIESTEYEEESWTL